MKILLFSRLNAYTTGTYGPQKVWLENLFFQRPTTPFFPNNFMNDNNVHLNNIRVELESACSFFPFILYECTKKKINKS